MYREIQAPRSALLLSLLEVGNTGLWREQRSQGTAGLIVCLFSPGFVSRQLAPHKHLRVLPTRTRPSLFGGA